MPNIEEVTKKEIKCLEDALKYIEYLEGLLEKDCQLWEELLKKLGVDRSTVCAPMLDLYIGLGRSKCTTSM